MLVPDFVTSGSGGAAPAAAGGAAPAAGGAAEEKKEEKKEEAKEESDDDMGFGMWNFAVSPDVSCCFSCMPYRFQVFSIKQPVLYIFDHNIQSLSAGNFGSSV